MILRYLLGSWSPNKYHRLGELSVVRLLKLAGLTALLSVFVFLLLSLPALFQADEAVAGLRKTTAVSVNASLTQSTPTYVLRNPDILVTTGDEDGFITITPRGLSVKQFIYFGERTFEWRMFSSLHTVPATAIATRLALLLLPSLLFWGALAVLLTALFFAVLYSFITYFVLHAKQFHISYQDLFKVTVYAALPSMMVLAGTPILRLGLPIAIILGFIFVLWLVLSLLGTALFAERHVDKAVKPKKARA